MLAVIRLQKITFGEMRFTSVRGGLLHFEALAAKTTNPQQNNLKPPECDRNHRSNHRSVPRLFAVKANPGRGPHP